MVESRDMLDLGLLAPEKPRPLKRDEYDRLVALDVFEDERVELLYGTLVAMSPNYPEHSDPIARLTMVFAPALAGRAVVRVQLPYWAVDESEPEPDIALVAPGDYRQRHPSEAELVVEVAVSSLKKDRRIKAPLYAASGVREYWIVNVTECCIEVLMDSDGRAYRDERRIVPGETLRPLAFPDVAVDVAGVFGL